MEYYITPQGSEITVEEKTEMFKEHEVRDDDNEAASSKHD